MNLVKLFVLLTGIISSAAFAKDIGVVMIVRGEATLLHAGSSEKVKVASKLNVGDQVETQANSYVKIVMNDRNVIVITEKTKIKIDEYTNSSDIKKVKLSLEHGSVRHVVNEKYDKPGQYYEVKTSTSVAGVRGTDFITEYNMESGDTVLCALKGVVSFDLLKDSVPENKPVLVAAGNFVRFKKTDSKANVTETKKPWLEKALLLHSLD